MWVAEEFGLLIWCPVPQQTSAMSATFFACLPTAEVKGLWAEITAVQEASRVGFWHEEGETRGCLTAVVKTLPSLSGPTTKPAEIHWYTRGEIQRLQARAQHGRDTRTKCALFVGVRARDEAPTQARGCEGPLTSVGNSTAIRSFCRLR